MKLLLDTHILIWSQSVPKRISGRVARIIEDSRTERWISPASFWEILSVWRRGRIRFDQTPSSWFASVLEKVPSQEATFTYEVAMAMYSFVLPHGDPIDAILVATAKVYGLTLVTSDLNLIAAKACPVLANR